MKKLPPESEIMAIIKDNNREKEQTRLFKFLYQHFKPKILGYIKKHSSITYDVNDLFQDVLLQVVINIQKGKYKSKGKFPQYVMGVTRNILYKRYKVPVFKEFGVEHELKDDTEEIINKLKQKERRYLFYKKHFDSMKGTKCYEVLTFKIKEKWSLSEIQKKMNWSIDYTKKQSSVCKKKLIALIRRDPNYPKVNEEESILFTA